MIEHVLFDLDETLYPTSAGVMREISRRMNEYMVTRLGYSPEEVTRARQAYWEKYGTTLRGLYLERHIDAGAFLEYVHAFRIEDYLRRDTRLDTALGQVRASKYVFTNATAEYARRVLGVLGVERHFVGIFDIFFIAFESKPALSAYVKVLEALKTPASQCLMVDDSLRNLLPAKKLGMRTVLLDGSGDKAAFAERENVDGVIRSIYDISQIPL